MGTDAQVRRAQSARPDQQNALSVALELQADCYAGVWGHHAAQGGGAGSHRVTIETGDVEAGLKAAAAIGDDRIQRMQTGHVAPDRFTHGSSEQRVTWFRRGLDSGDPNACNTFK
jgi:predicted metalloprotease